MKRSIVFLKQVPLSTQIGIDPITRTLKRSSALNRTNPDDLYALQMALDFKKTTGAEVVAVSMGPASAEEVLREALQRGADRAILLSSPAFAGSDTWCTSHILATAVRQIGDFDLLFFGRMAIDGDTAQVGPEVAGQLDIPQITFLEQIDAFSHDSLLLTKRSGETSQQIEVRLPCAIMVSHENGKLSCPTLKGWRRAQQLPILRWDERVLSLSPETTGLQASPTKVVSTSVPENRKNIEWLQNGSDFLQILQKLIDFQNK